MKKKFIVLFAVYFALSGCDTLNTQFDCPLQAGINCKSLDEINHMVDSGHIFNSSYCCQYKR